MDDRIKLAEAMGWEKYHQPDFGGGHYAWRNERLRRKDASLPDPYTDANDDYAVLEWMRENHGGNFWVHFENTLSCNYQIGDYARAALKVIDEL
jgi:hypothetical protein